MNELAIDYLQQAITLMGKPNYEAAEDLVKKALELEPRYKEAYSVLGDIYVNIDQLENALETFKKVSIIDPEDGENYFNLGGVYILLDDIAKAIECYNTAEEKGFTAYQLYRNLAKIYRELGNTDQALRNYNKAIREAPLFTDLRLEKASYYLQLGRMNEALEALDELQKLEPDLFDVFAMKAEIYCGMGQQKTALELVEDALASFPEDVALKTLKAKVLIQLGKYDDAQMLLSNVQASDQYEVVLKNCMLLQAQINSANNKLPEAADNLREIIEHEEEFDEEVHFLLLNVCFAMKDYDTVLAIAKELSLRKEDNLYTVTGRFYVPYVKAKQGKTEEARKEFVKLSNELRRVTVRHPHFYEGYLYRLLCHKELKEYQKALEIADYIEALDERSVDAFSLRYAIYKDMGDQANADKMTDIVKKMRPDFQL